MKIVNFSDPSDFIVVSDKDNSLCGLNCPSVRSRSFGKSEKLGTVLKVICVRYSKVNSFDFTLLEKSEEFTRHEFKRCPACVKEMGDLC